MCNRFFEFKKPLILLFLIPVLSGNVFAQEHSKDTVRISLYDLQNRSNPSIEEFEFMPQWDLINESLITPGNIKLFSSYLSSSPMLNRYFISRTEPHLLSNYQQFYMENSAFNTVKYILGLAQLSAAGYLAYRHIKKYGLK